MYNRNGEGRVQLQHDIELSRRTATNAANWHRRIWEFLPVSNLLFSCYATLLCYYCYYAIPLLPPGLPSRNFAAPFLWANRFLFLVFPYFFLFLCRALDWAGHFVSFRAHVNISLYRFTDNVHFSCRRFFFSECWSNNYILCVLNVQTLTSVDVRECT